MRSPTAAVSSSSDRSLLARVSARTLTQGVSAQRSFSCDPGAPPLALATGFPATLDAPTPTVKHHNTNVTRVQR